MHYDYGNSKPSLKVDSVTAKDVGVSMISTTDVVNATGSELKVEVALLGNGEIVVLSAMVVANTEIESVGVQANFSIH